MKVYVTLILALIFSIEDAIAQTPPIPECPFESNVLTILSELDMDIIFGDVKLDKKLQKKLKDAAYTDITDCQNVANGMHNWIEESIRMKEENNRLLQEITNLKLENALMKRQLDQRK